MIVLRSALTPCLELVGEKVSSSHTSAIPSYSTFQHTDYSITDWSISPSALLFLVDDEQLVIKMLCPYQDTRYSLKDLSERQQCLLEALKRNRVFTPELYLGLAPLYHLDRSQKNIRIGEVIEQP